MHSPRLVARTPAAASLRHPSVECGGIQAPLDFDGHLFAGRPRRRPKAGWNEAEAPFHPTCLVGYDFRSALTMSGRSGVLRAYLPVASKNAAVIAPGGSPFGASPPMPARFRSGRVSTTILMFLVSGNSVMRRIG